MAISGPKQPMMNNPAAIAITTKKSAAWWKMKLIPSRMSRQIAWMRFDEDSVEAGTAAARWIATDPMSPADATKLSTSSA